MKSNKVTKLRRRLKEVFGNAPNKEIARQLGLSNATITTYMQGRIPPPETLIHISRLKGCSVHWLVTGQGSREVDAPRAHVRAGMKVIVLANAAGGEAKSTSAAMLAAELARRGYRTLLVDTPGGSCAVALFPALMRKYQFKQLSKKRQYELPTVEGRAFFRTRIKRLHLCSMVRRQQQILKSSGVVSFTLDLSTLYRDYEFIILDTDAGGAFSLVELLIGTLLASVHVLIPTSGSPIGLDGVAQTLRILRRAQRSLGGLEILGTFVIRCHPTRVNIDEIREILEDLLPGKVLKAVVRHDNSLAEFDGYGINRLTRERSPGAADYASLVDEILELTT